ncbi:MAG: GCN5-related N-acetyltransferase [Firmicutes bacterium]|nr:GCN5-related N-acetyltransferase [Bacillota bacterium]
MKRCMQITLAFLKDIKNIMGLIKNCIKDMESQGIYQWDEYYPTAEIFEEDIKSGSLYILEDKRNCLGVISINEKQSPEYKKLHWSVEDGKVLVIHRLAVNPECQKQGVGRQLMDFAEKYAAEKGYTSIRLDAYSGNPRALNLYERRGYQKVGQLSFPRREFPFYCYEKAIERRKMECY